MTAIFQESTSEVLMMDHVLLIRKNGLIIFMNGKDAEVDKWFKEKFDH